MNQRSISYFIFISVSLAVSGMNAMDVIEQKLQEYEALYRIIATSNVISPRLIKDVFNETRNLDHEIEQLSPAQRRVMLPRATRIQLEYRTAFTRAVRSHLASSFALDQDRIYKIVGATTVSAVWASSLSLVYFWLQQQTGNITQIDQTKLVVAGLEGVVAELVRQGFDQYNTRVGNLAAEMSKSPIMSIASAGAAMAVHKKTFIASPTKMGVLMAGLKSELFVIFNDIIEKEGGIAGILRKVKLPKIVFGTTQLPTAQQQLVLHIQPTVRNMLVRPQIQQALMHIVAVTTESLLVGILAYYVGLGFADEPGVTATLVGSAYRGLIEGSFAYMMQTSGGAIPLLAGGLLSRAVQNDLMKGAGLAITDMDMATILIEKGMHTALAYTMDESGGLGNFTKLVISKTVRAVNQKWWIPFKEFCNQVGDSVLHAIAVQVNYGGEI